MWVVWRLHEAIQKDGHLVELKRILHNNFDKIRQAKLNLEKTSNTLENLQRAIDLQLSASSILFKNALLTLDVQDQNVALAEKVYNTTLKKYEQGLGSSFELLQTETELENAQSNYFQALYDAVTSKIAYTKALGKL